MVRWVISQLNLVCTRYFGTRKNVIVELFHFYTWYLVCVLVWDKKVSWRLVESFHVDTGLCFDNGKNMYSWVIPCLNLVCILYVEKNGYLIYFMSYIWFVFRYGNTMVGGVISCLVHVQLIFWYWKKKDR